MGTGGSFRIVIAFICCGLIVLGTGYKFLARKSIAQAPILEEETEQIISSGLEIAYPESGSLAPIESTNAPQEKGNVIGSVKETFISPYTAKENYNNVYIKNSTDLKINIKSLLNANLGFRIQKNTQPQVLILHTHATETFLSGDRDYFTDTDYSRTTDTTKNMVAIGKIVAQKLNEAGIVTLHDATLHDYPSYNEAYTRSAKTINSYKKQYPSIKIVIDLHRDAISGGENQKIKLTSEIGGKKAAQVMLVMGSQSGSVKNFPNWQENLKLALKLQQTLEVMYPSLPRALSLMPKNYNQSLTNGSMLIEIGTDANSLEEVKYSAELLGNALKALLNTL